MLIFSKMKRQNGWGNKKKQKKILISFSQREIWNSSFSKSCGRRNSSIYSKRSKCSEWRLLEVPWKSMLLCQNWNYFDVLVLGKLGVSDAVRSLRCCHDSQLARCYVRDYVFQSAWRLVYHLEETAIQLGHWILQQSSKGTVLAFVLALDW